MDDQEAFELIDAHLDRQTLTEEQSRALADWIKADPRHADEAFQRIFLHSYLRSRLRPGLMPPVRHDPNVILHDPALDFADPLPATISVLAAPDQQTPRARRHSRLLRWGGFAMLVLALSALGLVGWWRQPPVAPAPEPQLYAYEGFSYPATPLPVSPADPAFSWPISGGLEGLNGGTGWESAWQETNSKVALIVDYSRSDLPWETNDMRKFGPLGYSDLTGQILQSSGHQMRTASSPRSITIRRFAPDAFPTSFRDGERLGRDGSVLWMSFLAQSSLSTAANNRYSYLVLGSKSEAGFRIGKLGAAPSGNWTAVGLLTGSEVNLKSSTYPSGEMVFLVTRLVFRPGPEDATVWINPPLDSEPPVAAASLHLQIPDFRFDGLGIHANHSSDFDEIRFGNSFAAVAPRRTTTKAPVVP